MATEAHLRLESTAGHIAVAVLGAAVVGLVLPASPVLAGGLVGSVVLAALIVRFGVLAIAVLLTATLPWLVTMSELLPRYTVTFTAGATALAIAFVASPKNDASRAVFLLRLGLILFFAPVLLSLARASFGAAFIHAAKLIVFPLMVVVIAQAANRRDLLRLKTIAVWSSAAAITVNLVIGFSGVANSEFYGAGEVLGYGSAHTIALLSGCLFAVVLASHMSVASASVAAVSAVAAVATGVRSVLPGLALVTIARVLSGRRPFRVLVLVSVAAIGIFASGAADVVEGRFRQSEAQGEFQSFSTVGSGRGAIYSTGVKEWWGSSPIHWVVGTGLRSIGEIQREQLGAEFGGHSDVVDVGVQLGLVGLVGLILMWAVLIARAGSRLPLFVLGSFALVDGLLEYSGVVVIGVLFTAGLEASERTRGHDAHVIATRTSSLVGGLRAQA